MTQDSSRIAEAGDWFARMRGPDAEQSRGAFEEWLRDEANANAFAEIETIWKLSRRRPTAAANSNTSRAPWHRSKIVLIAAALVASVLLAVIVLGLGRPDGSVVAAQTYATTRGAIRQVVLSDGSRATLDTQSRIVFRATPTAREAVLEKGRARFAVAHGDARPFVVLVAGQAVVATGTLFDVRLDGNRVEVTLLEGGVDLERGSPGHSRERVAHLRPGQRAVMTGRMSAAQISPIRDRSGEWPTGLLTVDRRSLASVVAEANRYEVRQIELDNPETGRLMVSGAFRPGRTEELARSLAAALELTLEHRSDGVIRLARQQSNDGQRH